MTCFFFAILVVLGLNCCDFVGDSRTWKDSTGKFSVEAELISVEDGQVVLKTAAGKEVKISLERLCKEDQLFATKSLAEESPKPSEVTAEDSIESKSKSTKPRASSKVPPAELVALKDFATRFYDDLTTKDRMLAREMLTDEAKAIADENKSALTQLPSPDKRADAIRVGTPKISSGQAIVPVKVKIEGVIQNTSLHLRKVEEEWKVFAISAKVGNEENSVHFEAAIASSSKKPRISTGQT